LTSGSFASRVIRLLNVLPSLRYLSLEDSTPPHKAVHQKHAPEIISHKSAKKAVELCFMSP
jgi:hypothetical protein